MPEKLVKISAYNTPFEANYAQNLLAAEGIQSCLDNEATVGLFGALNVAVGGVKLYVAEADADRARKILSQSISEQASDTSSDETAIPSGKCPKCQAKLEPGFEVCWSCGQPLEAKVTEREIPPAPTAAPSTQTDQKPPTEQKASRRTIIDEADDLAQKAWFASILGFFICLPLLHVYSVWLIALILANRFPLSRRGSRRLLMAAAVDVLVFALVGWLVWWNVS